MQSTWAWPISECFDIIRLFLFFFQYWMQENLMMKHVILCWCLLVEMQFYVICLKCSSFMGLVAFWALRVNYLHRVIAVWIMRDLQHFWSYGFFMVKRAFAWVQKDFVWIHTFEFACNPKSSTLVFLFFVFSSLVLDRLAKVICMFLLL